MNKKRDEAKHRFSDEEVAEKVKEINYSFGNIFEKMLMKAGITVSDAARFCGISRTTFVKKLEPGSGNKISIGMLYVMPDEIKIAFCKHLLGEKYDVVSVPDGDNSESDHYRFLSSLLRQANGTFAHALESAADGRLTRSEGAELTNLCDKTISGVVKLRELGNQAVKEGVIGVQRARIGDA